MADVASLDEMEFAQAFTKSKRLAADATMPIRFYMGAELDEKRSKLEGRPIYNDAPFIEIFIPGDKDNVVRRKVWDEPGVENSDTARWPKQWAAFKAGQEQVSSGTPIDKLPGITEGQCRELAFFHVRTIEHLAGLSDEHASRSMGLVALKQRAQAWLDAAAGNAPLEAAKAALEEERTQRLALEDRLAALERAAGGEVKRGPGRPPKHVES